MDFINQVKKTTTDAINSVSGAANEIKVAVEKTTAGAIASVSNTVQPGIEAIQNAGKSISNTASTTVAFATSGVVIGAALKDLPQTAQQLLAEMPKIANRLKYRAGVRVGEAPRSDADVMKLFNKIPGTSKLDASERDIRQFLSDKHGSHIYPHSKGGSNGADNIVWEIGADNIRRGTNIITPGEQAYIRVYNAVDSILRNSTTIAKLGITATGAAMLTQAIVVAISYSLDLQRGDITVEQYKDLILQEVIKTGIATPIFFLIFVVVLALIPELTVLLSAPIVVAGFNALFGMSIAVPIVQSVIRHIEAGGFGEETANQYKKLSVS
ncbi:HNH endonuclease [Calothrix sp. HK-06]|nr:HNH endonuclease [Calothrix sp. HK-06]